MAPTRRARFRRRVYGRLPLWLREHDFEIFTACLAIIGGAPLVLGQIEPTSAEALLPYPVVFLWGLTLVLGGLTVLLGLIRTSQEAFPQRAFWMRVEALGLAAMAYFCYVYVVVLLVNSWRTSWLAAMIILSLGIVCHVRETSILIKLEEYRSSLGLDRKA